jgi:putative oxidoreductase
MNVEVNAALLRQTDLPSRWVGPALPVTGHARLVFPALKGFYARVEPISYVILRVGFGLTMATHGFPKLLGMPHGSMANPIAGSTNLISNALGLPFAAQLAMFVAILEGIGGLMVAAGMLTRLLAPMMAIQMIAICYVLGPTYPWIDRGIEYPIVLGLVAFFISTRGDGPASVDRMIGREL